MVIPFAAILTTHPLPWAVLADVVLSHKAVETSSLLLCPRNALFNGQLQKLAACSDEMGLSSAVKALGRRWRSSLALRHGG